MSSPEPVPPEEPQRLPMPEPAAAAPEDEGSALIPVLLIAYSAYLLWRGSHDTVPKNWKLLVVGLGLRQLMGAQLAVIASRALGRQRDGAGRAGDELWQHAETGIQAGIDAGLQAVAQALIWTDSQVPDGEDPVTKDAAPGEGALLVPTLDAPPELLSEITALAVVNAAVFAVAQAAGWTTKIWNTRKDARVRETHRALQGEKVPTKGVFMSPSGAKLRYPGDPKAPIAEVANCRCWLSTARR